MFATGSQRGNKDNKQSVDTTEGEIALTIIIGIDPGISGAAAALLPSGPDIIVTARSTERDLADWLAQIDASYEAEIWLEQVHAMPRPRKAGETNVRGSKGTAVLMQNYGFWRGLVISQHCKLQTVTAATWQRSMKCLTKGDKKVSKARAQELYPCTKVTLAIADALLIAEYGRRQVPQNNNGE